jgi:hypothetical protein
VEKTVTAHATMVEELKKTRTMILIAINWFGFELGRSHG